MHAWELKNCAPKLMQAAQALEQEASTETLKQLLLQGQLVGKGMAGQPSNKANSISRKVGDEEGIYIPMTQVGATWQLKGIHMLQCLR